MLHYNTQGKLRWSGKLIYELGCEIISNVKKIFQ